MNRRTVLQTLATTAAVTPIGYTTPTPAATVSRPSVVRAKDGCGLSYAVWGKAGPAVLLVHSWSMNSGIWRHQVRALTRAGFRVVTFDRRGHGRSQMTGQGYDFDTLSDDLAMVVEQLNLRDLTLVAHSMGSGEVVHYLARHGIARVRKVILLAPTTPFLTKTADNPWGIERSVLAANVEKMSRDFPKWAADNAAAYFRPETSPETVSWATRMLVETPTEVAIACTEVLIAQDFRPDLATLNLPVLVIHGDADASAPLAVTGRPTAALVKGAQLVVIPGAPHGLYETDAARVNDEIIRFVGGA